MRDEENMPVLSSPDSEVVSVFHRCRRDVSTCYHMDINEEYYITGGMPS